MHAFDRIKTMYFISQTYYLLPYLSGRFTLKTGDADKRYKLTAQLIVIVCIKVYCMVLYRKKDRAEHQSMEGMRKALMALPATVSVSVPV
jgi:hypothetical protein